MCAWPPAGAQLAAAAAALIHMLFGLMIGICSLHGHMHQAHNWGKVARSLQNFTLFRLSPLVQLLVAQTVHMGWRNAAHSMGKNGMQSNS